MPSISRTDTFGLGESSSRDQEDSSGVVWRGVGFGLSRDGTTWVWTDLLVEVHVRTVRELDARERAGELLAAWDPRDGRPLIEEVDLGR